MNKNLAVLTNEPIFSALKQESENSDLILHHNPQIKEIDKEQIVVCDEVVFKKSKSLQAHDKDLLFLISTLSDDENISLIQKHGIRHLIGMNESVFAGETISHIMKLFTSKIWGLEPYMDDSLEIKVLSLSDSKFTNEMITDALGHFDFEDYFSSPLEYIQVMANELISNSLYKGPNKKRSEQGLDGVDRKTPVFLKGSDLVQVTLAKDESGIALSVQDSFGGLSYEVLIESLTRSFREKTVMDKRDGAGLGLYLTFLHSNQFIINYRENYRTEVICIIERNKRYKHYKQRVRSFHFFQEVQK